MAITGFSLLPTARKKSLYKQAQQEYQNYINYVNSERERVTEEKSSSKNKGGLFGGLGYLGEKIGLGFLSGIEGIWDYTAGGVAKLFGADDWAEERFDNDWVNYNHADEWFDPSSGWKIAGDVAGGIGTSLPALGGAAAGAAIIYASGGSLSSWGAKLITSSISAGIAGFGAAGNATKEAYRETGQLTGKEFGYGALSGATEAGLELATAGIAKGTGRLVSKFGQKAVDETAQAVAKTVAKTGSKSVFKELGEDFVTEAFEEGFSEFISPYYKRATYNPNAELASASEIAYASIVGGISGSIMTGVPATINTTVNLISGKKSVDKGTAAGVLEQGRVITENEKNVALRLQSSTSTSQTTSEASQVTEQAEENGTGIGAFEAVKDTYDKLMNSLKKHNEFTGTDSELIEQVKQGTIKFNSKEMMYLGQLKKDGALARLHPYIERSAEALVLDADGMANRYSSYGLSDANGKPINVTAAQILSGIDSTLVEKAKAGKLSNAEAKTLTKQLRKALKSNSVLSTLATAEATGNIFVDTKRMSEAMMNNQDLINTANVNRIIAEGTAEEKRDLGKALGIEDWATVTGDEVRRRLSALMESGKLSEAAEQSRRIRKALDAGKENAKPLPHMLRKNMQDGVYRYKSEDGSVDMAVLKDGDNYYLYDYEGKQISRALTSKDINGILKKYWTSGETTAAESMLDAREPRDSSRADAELDSFAMKNIPEYKSLSAPNQSAIRMTLRQALAHGLSEADALTMARFAAKSGLNVIFNASRAVGDGCFVGNTVYVNPNISIERTFDMVLGHEMFHGIFAKGGKRAMKLYNEAKEFLSSEKAEKVENRYKEFYAELKVEKSIAESIAKEEVSAHGSEVVFKSKEAWEYILGEDSSIGDGVLSFFRKSARKYSEIQQMSAQARKFIRHYKKLFNEISARNQGNNSLSLALDGAQRKTPIIDRMGENVKATSDVDTDTRFALIGRTEDGRGIYRTNYPENTPKDVKQKDIVDLVQNVWSKKPIKLNLIVDGKEVSIEARFNPELTERSDLSKIAFGNRKGTASEKRITMNLSSDLYQIAEESHHVRSKTESGKDNAAHAGVTTWHYFLTDLVYVEADGTEIECYMNIDVKQNDSGHWFYSFAIEKGSRPADVLSVVTDKSATTSTISITENAEKSNPSDENSSKNPTSNPDIRFALTYDEDLAAIFGDIDMNADADGASFDIEAILERGIPRKPGASTLTIGEMKKTIANNTHYQVFSKGKALEVIGRMFGTSDLTAKTRAKLADALWQGFNDCTDVESRQTFARDMAEFIVATMVTEAKVENPDVMEAQERLSYLSTYIGKITFHPDDLSEIRHIADKAGLKKILGRWGYKGKKGTSRVPMDVFACDIAREMPGMSALEDMHPVEAFMELDAMYERAREDVKDKWISAYWEATDADMLTIVAGIEADIMKAFETEGEQSKFSRLVEGRIEYYSTRAEFWKAEHDRIKGRDRILGLLMSQAQKMKDLRLGTFANATQFDSELFKNSIEKLAKIQFRGNLNVTGTRKIFAELLQWYRKDNPLLEYVDESNTGLYAQSIADMLEYISKGEKGFTKDDLLIMYDVMSYFVKFVENYGKVFRNGKMVEAKPLAEKYIEIMQSNSNLKVGLFAKVAGSWYAELFNDPASLARRMDYYESGFYTEMYEDLRSASVDAEIAEMNVMKDYDEFLRKNKKYIKNASVETVEYRGQKISKLQLIDVYMTMKRKHAWAGMALNGFKFKNLDGKVVRVQGFVTDDHISEEELAEAIFSQQAEIAKHFTDADLQYMAILEKGYNEDARKMKAERDMQRLGFTNATNDYYYPIRRAYTAQNIDANAKDEFDRVTNSSFNKDIVKGAKQELAIESADSRFRRHVHAVCQYAYLSPAVEAFNRLYNLDVADNKNRPVSVRTEGENGWAKGYEYFKKLISDIQGIPSGSNEGMALLSRIRGSYAKFQLGANPKVWITQMSSLFASSSILDADSIIKGFHLSSKGIDEYAPIAALRRYDNTAAMAQAVLDKEGKARGKTAKIAGKVGKFSDLLMQPIGMMDRFVVCRLFGACQVQVAKNGGAKVGTEANKIEAGKLLQKVILETQQNSLATERSKAMRSNNELLRTATMFSADAMKVISRVIDAHGEIAVLRAKIKATSDANTKETLKKQLKTARRKERKAVTALVLSAIFMASIAQLFRHIYNKDEEDESVIETMTVDAVGNLFGGFPLFKDAYAYFFEGYDVDNYAYSMINDILSSSKALFVTSVDVVTGNATSQDVARNIKNLSYSFGQFTGIPTRNVYNVFYGLTKRFSPETAYKIDNAFYKKNYQSDFYKAIENDDAEMASFILDLLYNERTGENISAKTHKEVYSLAQKGYKVIPKTTPSSITIDGAEYELNLTEYNAVRDSYSSTALSLDDLISSEYYKNLSDELKADAINYVYDLRYDKAIHDVLGIYKGNSVIVSDAIGIENMATLYIATKGIISDTDKLGNVISGSKRSKVISAINSLNIPREQKLLMIAAKGYTVKDGDIRGLTADRAKTVLLNYILRSRKLNKEQKTELAKMCGFEVRNGRIMLKTPS